MVRAKNFWPLAITLLCLSACAPIDTDVSALTEKDIRAIRDSQQFFVAAETAGNWAEASTVFADDAVRLMPNMLAVEGRSAIREQLETSDTTIRAFSLDSVETIGQANLAVDRGTYLFSFVEPDSGSVITDRGKYVTVWRRQPDGVWRIAIDTYNSDLPVE